MYNFKIEKSTPEQLNKNNFDTCPFKQYRCSEKEKFF